MKPFGAFRSLVEPDAVTAWFVLFRMDRNIIFVCQVMHKQKTPVDIIIIIIIIIVAKIKVTITQNVVTLIEA